MKVKPKDLKKLERLGVKAENINATRVVIETPEENIIVDSPIVTKANVMGQEAITVMGQIRVEKKSQPSTYKDEDVRFIMEQTGKSEAEAKEALAKAGGDIAKAILLLTEGQGP
ncbi:transcription factor [Metallosphaera yellowstonensis MK1]|jgi:nascent polypeptide-associated complex subunit alpha|uniref:Nascent polypeptide-associated complex protein n=2 Tax=Metallosphaera TaxID=41980 RepID=H2C811_9CREN|nr:transcription factor [Metallosphaera yellowstonensis MK1]